MFYTKHNTFHEIVSTFYALTEKYIEDSMFKKVYDVQYTTNIMYVRISSSKKKEKKKKRKKEQSNP